MTEHDLAQIEARLMQTVVFEPNELQMKADIAALLRHIRHQDSGLILVWTETETSRFLGLNDVPIAGYLVRKDGRFEVRAAGTSRTFTIESEAHGYVELWVKAHGWAVHPAG